jgi:hypothetical protein
MRAQDAALALHMGDQWQRRKAEKLVEFWQGEVERLQVVLRDLLAGTAAEDNGPDTGH